jgi:transcriptional regulator GlxA family with amidase domain
MFCHLLDRQLAGKVRRFDPTEADPMDLDLIAGRDQRIARAMLTVLRNLKARPSRNQIARNASLEPTHFSKRFKDVVGVTFAAWNESVRVDAARQFLATTDRQVREIATAVGYRDTTTFERAFRRATGMCPRDYRTASRRRNPPNAETNPSNADSAPPSVA